MALETLPARPRPSKRSWGLKPFWFAVLAVYSYTLWLMLEITLQYIPIRNDAAFLAIKQDYVHLLHYRIAFFVHVFSAIFVLLAAYTQFSRRIRTRYKSVHKQLGRLYAYVTIFLAGPSGLIIGLYANGGLGSRIAFCLLAVLWVAFTLMGLVRMQQGKLQAHIHWMIRSYSLALSAITLRAWKVLIVAMFHPRPMDAYRIVAWLGWVLNLVLAELLILWLLRRKARKSAPKPATLKPTTLPEVANP